MYHIEQRLKSILSLAFCLFCHLVKLLTATFIGLCTDYFDFIFILLFIMRRLFYACIIARCRVLVENEWKWFVDANDTQKRTE